MHNLGITIYEGYGLTESSGSSTTNPHDAPRFGSVGKPIRGTRIAIDRSVPDSEREGEGEIDPVRPGRDGGLSQRPGSHARRR